MNIYIDRKILDKDKEKNMFNVTILKMKDIRKYGIGMIVTVIVVILASKYFPQATKEEKIVEKLVSENSMLECLDQTVPTISNINQEENKKEDAKEITPNNVLQGVLKTQISSIRGMENVEQKEKLAKEQQEKQEEQKKEEIQTARNQFSNTSYYKQSYY